MPAFDDRPRIFVSAGEVSGDMYAAGVVRAIRERLPDAMFFGSAGHRLREAGCEALLETESIAMVGLAEVVTEVPRVWRAYRNLLRQAFERRPQLAVLVDAPDFNLRLAGHFRRQGVPVLYVVAPQVWAWRPWRVRKIRRVVDRLCCIFPFEEAWFRERGVNAEYIGHPLSGRVAPRFSREEFFERYALDSRRPLLALLPGSRKREIALNLPVMRETAALLGLQTVVALPKDAAESAEEGSDSAPSATTVRGLTYDAIAHADVALVASGTVTIETALLGTPMVVVYRVTEPTWRVGRLLVRTRFYSMVNHVAERRVVPELIQDAFTPAAAAAEVRRLLDDGNGRSAMKAALLDVAKRLAAVPDPFSRAADRAIEMLGAAGTAKSPATQCGSWSESGP